METVEDSVGIISEQMHDILESMGADVQQFSLEYKEIPNKCGGNPNGRTIFQAMINRIPYKTVYFNWQMQAQTETDYINCIRAYMFSVLDWVANL